MINLSPFRKRHDIKESFFLRIRCYFYTCHTSNFLFITDYDQEKKLNYVFLFHYFSSPCVCGSRAQHYFTLRNGRQWATEKLKSSEIFPRFILLAQVVHISLALYSPVGVAVCVHVPRIHEWKRHYDICSPSLIISTDEFIAWRGSLSGCAMQ